MSILNSGIVPVGSTGGYSIDNSLRFNDDDSAYLSRTPSVAGNRKTWTFSAWVKRGDTITIYNLLGAVSGSECILTFGDYIKMYEYSGGYLWQLQTSALFRDHSAWYHIVVVADTTQGTSSDRIKFYINGEQVTAFSSTGYPALDAQMSINTTTENRIMGNLSGWGHFDGYLAEVNFVDGQALTPSDFGETDETYGHWKAKAYEGTYGTNGFYLDFKDSGSLGNDANGSNNWTPTNLAATDQMVDSPTNNFATLNPLSNGANTYADGNLSYLISAAPSNVSGSIGQSSGKWYFEVLPSTTFMLIGWWAGTGVGYAANTNYSEYFDIGGNTTTTQVEKTSGTTSGTLGTHTIGDIYGLSLDLDLNEMKFYRNNAIIMTISSIVVADKLFPTVGNWSAAQQTASIVNFGQDSSFAGNKTAQGNQDDNGIGDFYYAPPAGFLALCTKNLPEPTVVPSEHFNAVLWTGTTSVDRDITGIGFDPSLVWIKSRSDAYEQLWFDKVRGAGKRLISQNTNAESTNDSTLNAFITDGFTLGNGSAVDLSVNGNTSKTYVAWNWKANGAGVSNTDGSITSTVSANVDAGFSIVSWTGDRSGTSKSVGHGLSQTVEMVIYKDRGAVTDWRVAHHSLSANKQLALNGTSAEFTQSPVNLTSTTFETGVSVTNGQSTVSLGTNEIIAYAFHSVDGYSKVGSYTGNGSTDGTFVHCGFKPAYVIIKASSQAGYWPITNNKTLGYNPDNNELYANSLQVEASSDSLDYLSNGFKMRRTSSEDNGSGVTYIFLAFAEQPFKYTNAR